MIKLRHTRYVKISQYFYNMYAMLVMIRLHSHNVRSFFKDCINIYMYVFHSYHILTLVDQSLPVRMVSSISFERSNNDPLATLR